MTEYSKEEQKGHRVALVSALRSGKYKQGTSALRYHDSYCCLGVACDLAGVEWKGTTTPNFFYEEEIAGPTSFLTNSEGKTPFIINLSPKVIDYYGFTNASGEFSDEISLDGVLRENEEHSLIELNDGRGFTFDQIADFIETEPKGLFNE